MRSHYSFIDDSFDAVAWPVPLHGRTDGPRHGRWDVDDRAATWVDGGTVRHTRSLQKTAKHVIKQERGSSQKNIDALCEAFAKQQARDNAAHRAKPTAKITHKTKVTSGAHDDKLKRAKTHRHAAKHTSNATGESTIPLHMLASMYKKDQEKKCQSSSSKSTHRSASSAESEADDVRTSSQHARSSTTISNASRCAENDILDELGAQFHPYLEPRSESDENSQGRTDERCSTRKSKSNSRRSRESEGGADFIHVPVKHYNKVSDNSNHSYRSSRGSVGSDLPSSQIESGASATESYVSSGRTRLRVDRWLDTTDSTHLSSNNNGVQRSANVIERKIRAGAGWISPHPLSIVSDEADRTPIQSEIRILKPDGRGHHIIRYNDWKRLKDGNEYDDRANTWTGRTADSERRFTGFSGSWFGQRSIQSHDSIDRARRRCRAEAAQSAGGMTGMSNTTSSFAESTVSSQTHRAVGKDIVHLQMPWDDDW